MEIRYAGKFHSNEKIIQSFYQVEICNFPEIWEKVLKNEGNYFTEWF